MKKLTFMFMMIPFITLCSCNQNTEFNNELPYQNYAVVYEYDSVDKKVNLQCAFNYDGKDLFDVSDNSKSVNEVIGGDMMKVYYTDETKNETDHILVEQATILPLIEVTDHIVPGSDNYMQLHCDDCVIDQTDISFAINKDLSTTSLSDLQMGMSLFGTYEIIPIESEKGTTGVYKLSYLYSFNPREI